MIPFIDLKSQYADMRGAIQGRIDAVLEHGQYIMGPEVSELESQLASYVGVEHCICASSGTDTLLIALLALGIGSGDEVITSAFTFISTAETIALLGAKPVFVDIEPATFNICPDKIESAVTPRTRAVMPVSLFGQCADFDAIAAIAEPRGLHVIEDAAQSFGATYKGKRSCGITAIGSTSFFPSKPLGCYGDGGALFTNDNNIANVMREIRTHGQERRYVHTRLGLNGRMDTLQAAIVLAKLPRFDWEVDRRKAIGDRYSRLISEFVPGCRANGAAEKILFDAPDAPRLAVPTIESFNTSVFAQYTIVTRDRDAFADELKRQNIPTSIHYPIPLHKQPVFRQLGVQDGALPVSEAAARCVLSLPMGPYLRESDQDEVVAAVKGALSKSKL
jgi:UDP-2-acetamido-2-deoxy-ribo-hexuluronate aminotransferase